MPLLWLSFAFLAGILLADGVMLPWFVWLGAAGISIVAAVFESRFSPRLALFERWRRLSPLPLLVLLATLFAGAVRFQVSQPVWTPAHLAWYNEGGEALLVGVVVNDPDRRETGVLVRVRVRQRLALSDDGSGAALPVSGMLLARLPEGDWQYGDLLRLEGKPVTPAEDEVFSYRDYLARQGIYSYLPYARARLLERHQGNPLMAAIYRLRQHAHITLNRILPYPEAPLLAGILLGIERNIPVDLQGAFRDTGTSHIIAISGFNIAILAGLFAAVFSRLLPKMWAPLFSILAIAVYTLLVGAQASVVRAAFMGGFGLLGQQIGRRQAGINTLAFTAALMALIHPGAPWDVGFQLSFAATLGLILFSEPMQNWFVRLSERWLPSDTNRRLAGPVGEYFLFTLAAQVTTLPVILYHFRRLSIVSLLANPLILPPQPLVMVLGGIAVVAGMIFLPLGRLAAVLVWPLLAYTTRTVEWLAGWSGASISLGETGLVWVALYYAGLLGLMAAKPHWQMLRARLNPSLLLLALLLLNVVVWRYALTSPDGRLHLHVINLPNGQAVLLRTPDGASVLLNGGSSASLLSSALGRRLPPLGAHLDALVLTHNRGAALKGLPATLERFPPERVLWLPQSSRKGDALRLEQQLLQTGTPVDDLTPGLSLKLDENVHLDVLATNTGGAALLLRGDNLRLLLPGGIALASLPPETQRALQGVNLIVLGPDDLNERGDTGAWLRLAPSLVLANAAPPNGVPSSTVWVDARRRGWVEAVSDGRSLWLAGGGR